MSDIMQKLYLDHRNVAIMLDVLDRHLEAVHETETVDYELMHDVMVYMTSYPDRVHHPLEDLVFKRMQEKSEQGGDVLDIVMREHEGLAKKGTRFRDMLEHVVDGSLVLREELESVGRDYVEFLRHHMNFEDHDAFPLAEKVMQDDDWAWVTAQMEATEDPVFGPVVAENFASLLRHIKEQTELGE